MGSSSTPSSAPLVSVVSPYYNRQEHVYESVQSLLEQTYDNLEIVIVDDGSTDETYRRLCSFDDPRLRVIHQANQGVVGALRTAIDASQGEIVAVHGSGDISYPQRIEKQVALLQARPEIGVVGCYVKNVNTVNGYTTILKNNSRAATTESLKTRNVFTHGEVMYRRELYEQVGGYRFFFRYAEDRDLWLRMRLHTEFDDVEEVLYERFLLPDGVGLDLEKSMIQGYLADFAGQCISYREKYGVDPVDLYGEKAAFIRHRSRPLARRLHMYTTAALLGKDVEQARRFNDSSLQEARGVRNTLMQGLLAVLTRNHYAKTLFFRLLPKVREVRQARRKKRVKQS